MRFICHSYVVQLFHLFQLLHVFIELLHTDTQAITFIYIYRESKQDIYMYIWQCAINGGNLPGGGK
jgi:hypothetical protein